MKVIFAAEGVYPETPEPISKRPGKRLIQLKRAATLFEPGVEYSESDVNLLLMGLFQDHVFARRLLIESRVLDRTPDGSSYWLKEVAD